MDKMKGRRIRIKGIIKQVFGGIGWKVGRIEIKRIIKGKDSKDMKYERYEGLE